MAKYGKPETQRPKGFFPRIDVITVYAISVERMTGKEQSMPPLSEQWPAKDRTKTPNALAPEGSAPCGMSAAKKSSPSNPPPLMG
jgi:uncharacterized protein